MSSLFSTSTIFSIKLHKQYLIEIWWQWMRKNIFKYKYSITNKPKIIWNSCFEAFNTCDIQNIWWEFVPVKNSMWEKTALTDIVIGFHDSEFCRMVLSCATGGLMLNIARYRYGCDWIDFWLLNFRPIYANTNDAWAPFVRNYVRLIQMIRYLGIYNYQLKAKLWCSKIKVSHPFICWMHRKYWLIFFIVQQFIENQMSCANVTMTSAKESQIP